MLAFVATFWLAALGSVYTQTSLAQSLPTFAESLPSDFQSTNIGIRASWGGKQGIKWNGSIKSSTGAISDIRCLGITDDAPGSIYLENGVVQIRQTSPTAYNGIELFTEYAPDGVLTFELHPAGQPDEKFKHSVKLSELKGSKTSYPMEISDSQLNVARKPGDSIRIHFDRPHLVFSTNEYFAVGIEPVMTGLEIEECRIRVNLNRARSQQAVWSETVELELNEKGSADVQPFEFQMPSEEGVYELTLDLEPRNFTQRITSQNSIERKLQFVVLGESAPSSNQKLWREYLQVDPASQRTGLNYNWSQLVKKVGFKGNYSSKRVITSFDGKAVSELGADGWQAIGLKSSVPGQPHLIEVEYLAKPNSAISFGIIQTDSNGDLTEYGFDSGLTVPASMNAPELEIKKHQILFWPESSHSVLLVKNQSRNISIGIGKVRLLVGPDRLAADELLPDSDKQPRRQFLGFYEAPLFPENFGASEVIDPVIQQPLDDWVTFYQGADRMIQYLKANGYTGAFLNVASNSSTIYPSQLLEPIPLFDNGVYFASGQDPIPKDVVEMLMRMFDRENLKLVPSFSFTCPLPEVEQLLRNNRDDSIRPIDFSGQLGDINTGPRYNVLNANVQQAVANVIDEFARRYEDHSCFQGVSLLCRPRGYTQINGTRWGYDSPTVTQFLDETGGIQQASGVLNDWNQIQNFLLVTNKNNWIEWRSRQLADWYARLQAVAASNIQRRLYLCPIDIYQHPDIFSSLSPSLHWSTRFEEAMAQLGWMPQHWKNHPSIILLQPRESEMPGQLSDSRLQIQAIQTQPSKSFFASQTLSGGLFSHPTNWTNFRDDEVGQGTAAFHSRLSQLAPADQQNRKRFIQSIRSLDARLLVDGGWILTAGQEKSLVNLVDVFTRLPDIPFDDVLPTRQSNATSVVVRQAITDGRWHFYALNDSPWPMETELLLNRGQIERIESLSAEYIQMEEFDGGRMIRLTLEPYSIVGGFTTDPINQILDYQFKIDESVATELQNHMNRLQLRLIQAAKVKPIQGILNTEFNLVEEQSPAGWYFDKRTSEQFVVESEEDNNRFLKVNSDGDVRWIRSNVFSVTETGRISISVWLKSNAAQQQPPLRISLESEDQQYYRFGTIGSLAENDPANQVASEWRQFVVHFDDLPLERALQLRVGFDLMGAGEVHIDRVEVYDRLFDDSDIQALTQMLGTAKTLAKDPNSFDQCRQILDNYWLRFLDEYIGNKEPIPAVEAADNSQRPVRTSSVFERFKRLVSPGLNRR